MSGLDDAEANRRKFQAPYTNKHPIPTIRRFRKTKEARRANALDEDDLEPDNADADFGEGTVGGNGYSASDKHFRAGSEDDGAASGATASQDEDVPIDTSEVAATQNIKQKRKGMKKRKDERAERIVTDPVTHLPVRIHDLTSDSLKEVPKNEPAFGTTPRTATGLSNKTKSDHQLRSEIKEMEKGSFDSQFPPPDYHTVRKELEDITKLAVTVGIAGAAVVPSSIFLSAYFFTAVDSKALLLTSILAAVGIGLTGTLVVGVRAWTKNKIHSVWEDAIWQSKFNEIQEDSNRHDSETTNWLNSLLASLWPLINPDLFTSLADTLEDVMQASLPRVVRMVSIDDIGQGSESLRILGIRWLPTGAAARSVGADGKLRSAEDGGHHDQNDRANPSNGDGEREKDTEGQEKHVEDQKGAQGKKQSAQESQQVAEGMEAEEGDFVNLEVAFAYRASTSGHTFRERMKDMHLYLAFYLPGNIKLPVWVDLRGVVGTMRMRLQLAPDPPFFALCTLTFLGQPKVELSCVPLVQHGLNIMDLPLINRFVQSSVDAAMAEYVAPKSLTLDLKDMIAGDDFKKDVTARGVLVVTIIRGYDFKIGDVGIPLIKDGSADPYVSVGWAKFGKPLWSTRILESEMEPIWLETTYILVTPEELNVDERLRLQLWDSDRFTADDDLGRIEVDVKEIMRSPETNGRITHRQDGFKALKGGESMPGKLEWRVGYFSKVRIQQGQLDKQQYDPDTRTWDDLQKKATEVSERKLREADIKEGKSRTKQGELDKQKHMEFKSREDEMLISAPPPDGYPSGIFSIQIHQITGLELQTLNATASDKKDNKTDEDDESDDLPSAYCTVIINHKKVYKTRTKPKTPRPFYNAGTERFIPDWRNTEVHIAVRDARVHEDDPLLGIVHLPLHEVFKERSQINGFYPISGGIGYGRIRLSMVWRSVQLQAPKQMLGWQIGTVEVQPEIHAIDVPADLRQLKLKLQTSITSAKSYPSKDYVGWKAKKGRSLRLAEKNRYSSCLTVRFRHKGIVHDRNAAFAILWLRDIPDEEEKEMELAVWKGDFRKAIKCTLEQCGEQVGTIKLKLTFWSGLGAAHSKWAVKNADLRDVVQVLETAHDNSEASAAEKKAGIVDDDADSSSDDGDSSDDDEEERKKNGGDDKQSTEDGAGTGGGGGGGFTKGLIDEVKDYKDNYKRTHRRNRGLMTWKAPRTAQWAFHTAEKAESKVAAIFKRHSRSTGIETEV